MTRRSSDLARDTSTAEPHTHHTHTHANNNAATHGHHSTSNSTHSQLNQNHQPQQHHHHHHNSHHSHHHHTSHSSTTQPALAGTGAVGTGAAAAERNRLSSGAERHDASLATSITSSVIEKCDSPDDTSSIEGSTTHSLIEAESSVSADNLQCVLKDMDEYEFVVGVAEDRNKRCRRTMEDTHAFIYNYEGITGHGFFAIFDGHAGKAAADWCGQHFHEVFGRILEEKAEQANVDFQELVNETFLEVDRQLAEALQQGRSSGCTAIMAYIRKEGNKRVLYTGNVGDARAVLSHKERAVRLSYDHKGSDHTEAQRILDVGGFVMNNRVNGVLAVTRALGDSSMKEFIIGAPYTTRTEIGADNPYLILACDGLWDVCSDQEAVDLVKEVVCPTKASQLLLEHALQKFSTDNISVMVVRLNV
ncbi:Protein phosphatase 2C 1 [Linnemannia gamsii]|uniref:Protein phosphatase 2C 1 n=1 Tax=Linnemannia gamsii TaxID=64522 RepID=A0ABQ7JYQ2_9FUNG|nr:Protein phosphatase 2C 1 [Linnemannia gamsii]